MIDVNSMGQLAPDLLRSFIIAADTGNFTYTASLVHRTQAAVSMQMKRLEAELSCDLFKRQGRGVKLTSEGEILYRYAGRILELHDEAITTILKPKLNGVVKLGVPDDFATQHLPSMLRQFAIAHPQVQIDVYCDSSPCLSDMVKSGQLDIVITTSNVETASSTPLELVWILPERMSPSEIEVLPLGLFHPGCCYRENALQALESARRAYRVAYGSPSFAGVLAAVQGGLAIAPVTNSTVPPKCRHAQLADGLPSIKSAFIDIEYKRGKRSEVVLAFASVIGSKIGVGN